MIIPIKCFTCGQVVADRYEYFCRETRRRKLATGKNIDKVMYFTKTENEKTEEGQILDEMKLTKMCCRRTMLTHVDID